MLEIYSNIGATEKEKRLVTKSNTYKPFRRKFDNYGAK